jgi:hypothetical protein
LAQPAGCHDFDSIGALRLAGLTNAEAGGSIFDAGQELVGPCAAENANSPIQIGRACKRGRDNAPAIRKLFAKEFDVPQSLKVPSQAAMNWTVLVIRHISWIVVLIN